MQTVYCRVDDADALAALAANSDVAALLVLGGEDLRHMPRSRAAAAWCRARQAQGLPLPRLLLSGGGRDAPTAPTEAECMARFLQRQGLPAANMVLDTHARNTLHNMQRSRHLLDGTPARAVVLVTDAFHAPRSAWLYAQVHGCAPAAVLVTACRGSLRLRLRERGAWTLQAAAARW